MAKKACERFIFHKLFGTFHITSHCKTNLVDKCGFLGTNFVQKNHLPSTVSSNKRFTLESFCRNKFNEILFQGSAKTSSLEVNYYNL